MKTLYFLLLLIACFFSIDTKAQLSSASHPYSFSIDKGRQAGAPYPVIYTNLVIPTGNDLVLMDGVGTVYANRFSAAIDADDAVKLWNFDDNIALVRGNNTLAIEFRPVPEFTDTLFYRLYLRQMSYALQIFSQNLPANLPAKAWLIDKYLNTQTEVNLYDTTLYRFTPNMDTISYRNRFMLVCNRADNKSIATAKNITAGKTIILGNAATVNLYPNPISTGKAALDFTNMEKGSYSITVFTPKGKELATQTIEHRSGSNIYYLPVNSLWANGVYTINITNKFSGKTISLQLVISK